MATITLGELGFIVRTLVVDRVLSPAGTVLSISRLGSYIVKGMRDLKTEVCGDGRDGLRLEESPDRLQSADVSAG